MSSTIRLARSTVPNQTPTPRTASAVGEVSVNIPDRRIFMIDGAGDPVTVADKIMPFDAGRNYDTNDIVVHENYLWRAPEPVSAGTFNSSQWLKIGGEQINEGVLTRPQSVDRNTIDLTGQPAVKGLRIVGAATQTAPLLSIPGTSPADTRAAEVDAQGFPNSRFGANVFRVVQASHPFQYRGQPLAYNGSLWVLANAAQSALRAIGAIEQIIDANTFVVRVAGRITDLQSGAFAGGLITPGTLYYVSDTVSGQLTSTPSTIRPDPVLTAVSTTSGILTVGTAGSGSDYVQVTGDTMNGPLTMSGQQQLRFGGSGAYLHRSASTPSIMVGVSSVVAARFDERTQAAAYDETVMTRMKGDARYARLSGGAGATFTGGVTMPGISGTPALRFDGNPKVEAETFFFVATAGNIQFRHGGTVGGPTSEAPIVAQITDGADANLSTPESVVTRRKGDARYLQQALKSDLFSEIVNHLYPVGSTLLSTTAANPQSRFPGTTWVQVGHGRAIVGVGTADGVSWTAKQTRGTANVTLTESQIPSHRHLNNPPNTNSSTHSHSANPPSTPLSINSSGNPFALDIGRNEWGNHFASVASGSMSRSNGQTLPTADPGDPAITTSSRFTYNASHSHSGSVDISPFTVSGGSHAHSMNDFWSNYSGGGSSHTNIQPSMAFYIWERTA